LVKGIVCSIVFDFVAIGWWAAEWG